MRGLPENHGRPWSVEDDARLVGGWANEKRLEDIAASLGRTRRSCLTRMSQLRARGHDAPVYRARRWGAQDDAAARDMAGAGSKSAEIAQALGFSERTVRRALTRLGLREPVFPKGRGDGATGAPEGTA